MALGMKATNRKNSYIQLENIINLVEIKPWPPSKSLRSLRSVLIQWEHGDKNSGTTKTVAPSIVSTSGVSDGKIEFNESFSVHVTLSRDKNETFFKNCIEFNLYEPRRDKTVKGQLLATGIMDFAEYGIVEQSLTVSVPMNCKRMFGNTAQPMLFVRIQTVEGNNRVKCSSSCEILINEGLVEKTRFESVSVLMNEEYAEEAESESVTDDDDICSQSSVVVGFSNFGSNKNLNLQKEDGFEAICGNSRKINDQEISVQDKKAAYEERILSSKDLHSKLENARTTLSNLRNSRFTMLSQNPESYNTKLTNSSIVNHVTNEQSCIQSKTLGASQSGHESQLIKDFGFDANRLKNVKHISSSSDSCISDRSIRSSKILEKFRNVGVQDQNSKVQQLEQRVQALEDELREAAGIEVSLYSVVAEHGSSINKVHTPARRLSRLYIHACKQNNTSRKASVAKSIVSGLILVVKACGNDVPRLTFWLSNSVVLRAIIYKTFEKGHNELEEPDFFISYLEKVESWIFSRIIESIWWQTLAPYMHSSDSKSNDDQANTSLEHWKRAFMNTYERICPVRAARHNCGCLNVLSMLIMEQCMGRLDVGMFNAVLRVSDDEGPTDPVSDPISHVSVLPIPSGKASFGAGAQLKKTIGNWSSWLTDLIGSPITFHLLTALSELMMLPKDMLLSSTIRKEVCPTFGIPLIKRILDTFVPDEFCPDPIPEVVLETLDSEDLIECGEDCITSLPCAATPIIYHPPSTSLIGCILGDDKNRARLSRTGSSILRKSNTSDDELDELDSSLSSIIDSSRSKPVWTLKDVDKCNNTVRYQLLREIWMNSD